MIIEKIKQSIKSINDEISIVEEKYQKKMGVLEEKRKKLQERQQTYYVSLLQESGLDEMSPDDLKNALKQVSSLLDKQYESIKE